MLLTPVGVAAPIYAGWVFDTTGSYNNAFWLFTGLLTISLGHITLCPPPEGAGER